MSVLFYVIFVQGSKENTRGGGKNVNGKSIKLGAFVFVSQVFIANDKSTEEKFLGMRNDGEDGFWEVMK